jgi:uncharacterized protein
VTANKIEIIEEKLLYHTAVQLCNSTQLGSQVGLDHKTASCYLHALEKMCFLKRLDPWRSKRLKRVVKTPKIQFLDTELLLTLASITPAALKKTFSILGLWWKVLFMVKCSSIIWSTIILMSCLYYRDHNQYEVDFIIETPLIRLLGWR